MALRLELITFAEFAGRRPVGCVPNTRIVLCDPSFSDRPTPLAIVRSAEERHILSTNLKVFLPKSHSISNDEIQAVKSHIESHGFTFTHHLPDRLIFHTNPNKMLMDHKERTHRGGVPQTGKICDKANLAAGSKDSKGPKKTDRKIEKKIGAVMRCGQKMGSRCDGGWGLDGGWEPRPGVRDIDCLRCNERGMSYLPFSCCDRSLKHLGPARFARLASLLKIHPRRFRYCEKCSTMFPSPGPKSKQICAQLLQIVKLFRTPLIK